MSLVAESPVYSSSRNSSDDFAAYLEAELVQENEHVKCFQKHMSKRIKLENYESTEDFMNSDEENNVMCPPHPGFLKGMCVRCGLAEVDESMIAFDYIHKDFRLGTKEVDRLRKAYVNKLVDAKKLILILDLDHTLLNSTQFSDITPEEEEYQRHHTTSKQPDLNKSIFKLNGIHWLTKFRPFVHTFLQEASKLFEMYVYTMAERSYAQEIVKILDPNKIYFDSRVIARDDCTVPHQKGLDKVLGTENLVVILDDTEIVWKKHKASLILMDRYHFFASSYRQFGSNAKSLSELKKDESELDGALANVLKILKRAHQIFYSDSIKNNMCRDVRNVLKGIRLEILAGCNIVFSRLFPLNACAEEQPIWKMAKQLGANCLKEVDDSVTHVVSRDRNTDKARWALNNGKFLVNTRWIEAAVYRWRRQKEEDFQIVKTQRNK